MASRDERSANRQKRKAREDDDDSVQARLQQRLAKRSAVSSRKHTNSQGTSDLSQPAGDDEDGDASQEHDREHSQGAASSAPPTIAEGQLIDNEDADDLDADEMQADLKHLDSDASDLLDTMLPVDGTQGLRDPYSSWNENAKKRLDRDRTRFESITKHFTAGSSYINPEAVSRKLFANNLEMVREWRPSHIVYKANLVQLLTDLVLPDGRPDLEKLEYIENRFPKMIAGPVYNIEAFELAVDFTTQMVLARLREEWREPEDNVELVRDSFLIPSDDEELYRHWSSLGAETLQNRKHPKSIVVTRIDTLVATLKKHQKRSAIARTLRDDHPWSDFRSTVLRYCQSRRQELEAKITDVGGSKAVQQAVRLVTQGDTPRVSEKPDSRAPQPATNVPVPSNWQYSSAAARFLKQQNRKKQYEKAQEAPAPVEEDAYDLEGEPQDRDFGDMPVPTIQVLDKSHLRSQDTPYLPDIEPTQDAGIREIELPNRSASTPRRHIASPGPSRRHNQLARAQEDSLDSSDSGELGEEPTDLSRWRSLVAKSEIRNANTSLIRRREPRPWTNKEEDRLHLIANRLEFSRVAVNPPAVKKMDNDITSCLPGLQPELGHRTNADIRDKMRSMKRQLLIRYGSVDRLPPGWDGIWLPKQELDRVARAGIVYDQADAQLRYTEKWEKRKKKARGQREREVALQTPAQQDDGEDSEETDEAARPKKSASKKSKQSRR